MSASGNCLCNILFGRRFDLNDQRFKDGIIELRNMCVPFSRLSSIVFKC